MLVFYRKLLRTVFAVIALMSFYSSALAADSAKGIDITGAEGTDLWLEGLTLSHERIVAGEHVQIETTETVVIATNAITAFSSLSEYSNLAAIVELFDTTSLHHAYQSDALIDITHFTAEQIYKIGPYDMNNQFYGAMLVSPHQLTVELRVWQFENVFIKQVYSVSAINAFESSLTIETNIVMKPDTLLSYELDNSRLVNDIVTIKSLLERGWVHPLQSCQNTLEASCF